MAPRKTAKKSKKATTKKKAKVAKKTAKSPKKTKISSKSSTKKKVSLPKKKAVPGMLIQERVLLEPSDPARDLYSQSRYGTLLDDGTLQLSLLEALYLMERKRVDVKVQNKTKTRTSTKKISFKDFVAHATSIFPKFWVKYRVYKDLRSRGYVVRTALKFGADFRVYDRGVLPGVDHAKWIVYPVHEVEASTWHEFAAKNRVAHSTKKKLLIGVLDDEDDVSYWECRWIRP